MSKNPWVCVADCQVTDDVTEVYRSEANANQRYEEYAREHDIPFDEAECDIHWSESEYTAWTSRVEIRPQRDRYPLLVPRLAWFKRQASPGCCSRSLARATSVSPAMVANARLSP